MVQRRIPGKTHQERPRRVHHAGPDAAGAPSASLDFPISSFESLEFLRAFCWPEKLSMYSFELRRPDLAARLEAEYFPLSVISGSAPFMSSSFTIGGSTSSGEARMEAMCSGVRPWWSQ